MKSRPAFAFLLLTLSAGLGASETAPNQRPSSASAQNVALTPVEILSGQLKEIASSTTLSRKSQAKMITNAVRVAITAATEGIKDPAERLRLALELTSAAAKAAPNFAATITSAVSNLPVLSGIEGTLTQIPAAVSAGIAAADEAAGAASPTGNSTRAPAKPEFGGPNKGEAIVSPSH
jgi:hypothetical protein